MKNCIICGGQHQKMIYDGLLMNCMDCGFVTANLEIGYADLQSIYSEKYFKGDAYDDYPRDKAEHQQNFSKRMTANQTTRPAGWMPVHVRRVAGYMSKVPHIAGF
jgi:hypothetical protein